MYTEIATIYTNFIKKYPEFSGDDYYYGIVDIIEHYLEKYGYVNMDELYFDIVLPEYEDEEY